MKKMVALTSVILITSLTVGAKDKKQDRNISSTSTPIYTCGELKLDREGNKIIFAEGSQKGYMLIIDEVARPKGLAKDLISYESKVYQKLKEGSSYCALGLLGESADADISYLIQFSIVSSQ